MEPKNKERSFIWQTKEFVKKSFHTLNKSVTGVFFAVAFLPCVGLIALAAGDNAYDPRNTVNASPEIEEAEAITTGLTTTVMTTTSSTSSSSTSTSTSTTTTETTTTTVTSVESVEPEVVQLVASESEVEASQAETEESEADAYDDAADETTATESLDSWTITTVSNEELIMLAKTVAKEAGDCSYTQKAYVVWTVLNRVDSSEWPNTVYENLVKPNQFAYYSWKDYRDDHYQVVCDVVAAWENGGERPLPSDYQYFWGDGWRNHFYSKYTPGEIIPD